MPPQEELSWTVEFYIDRRGRAPVREYLRSLPQRERAEAVQVLDLLQEYGLHLGMPHARPIAGMWELRGGPSRIFYVAVKGRRFILLHGYRKRNQAAPQREIKTAQRRWTDFLDQDKE